MKTICSDLHVTRGEFDETAYPETKARPRSALRPRASLRLAPSHSVSSQVLTIGEFRFGLCHGHQVVPWGDLDSLAMLSRQLDVDVLITGHTHEFKAYKYEDRLFINPGSATGAYSPLRASTRPSFVLMDVDGQRLVAYVYQLVDGEVKVDKIVRSLERCCAPISPAHFRSPAGVHKELGIDWPERCHEQQRNALADIYRAALKCCPP